VAGHFRDVHVAEAVNRNPEGLFHLAGCGPERPPRGEKNAVGGEFLDPMVQAIRNVHVAQGIDRHADGGIELAGRRPERAPREERRRDVEGYGGE
jgi:hypothetical protein